MELTDEQKQTVREWVQAGDTLADVQKKLSSEFDLSMTYMDVRFLVLDLGLEVQDKPLSAAQTLAADTARAQTQAETDASGAGDGSDTLLGGVSVQVDRVMKPGSLVSGSVTFSDGVTASWALDQMGRLALDAGQPGYRPSEEDLRTFQDELRKALEHRGF